jgi:hypothetical protein
MGYQSSECAEHLEGIVFPDSQSEGLGTHLACPGLDDQQGVTERDHIFRITVNPARHPGLAEDPCRLYADRLQSVGNLRQMVNPCEWNRMQFRLPRDLLNRQIVVQVGT